MIKNIKLVLAFVLALFVLGGCSPASLPGAEAPQTKGEKIHDCAVQVLKPYVGVLAKDILAAVLAGGSLKQALLIHGVSLEDGSKIVEKLNECIMGETPPPPAPELVPS